MIHPVRARVELELAVSLGRHRTRAPHAHRRGSVVCHRVIGRLVVVVVCRHRLVNVFVLVRVFEHGDVTARLVFVRAIGGVETVDPDGGMFFVFPDARPRSFWMYDCLTAIDIAYVDPIGYVTAIHTMPAEPPRGETESEIAYRERLPGYSSRYPAQFAIELAPGMFESLGIEVGDRLSIPMDRLKRLGEAAEPDI